MGQREREVPTQIKIQESPLKGNNNPSNIKKKKQKKNKKTKNKSK
jgi:hypothetical protein